jgi:hypothetical protein
VPTASSGVTSYLSPICSAALGCVPGHPPAGQITSELPWHCSLGQSLHCQSTRPNAPGSPS